MQKTGNGKKVTDFSLLLDEVLPDETDKPVNLNLLWSDLPEIEKNLLDHPSSKNIKEYKTLVYKIAREILDRNVRVQTLKRKNSRGEWVELNLLEFLDMKLKKMAEIVFNPSLPAFHLLKTTEDIRGILIDYMQ